MLWPKGSVLALSLPQGLVLLVVLPVPIDPDEAVVQHCLYAGNGPSGLIVRSVLDQRRFRVTTKHHLHPQMIGRLFVLEKSGARGPI